MLGWILLAIGVVGFGYAGYKDLKTTEFEDWLPYSIIIAALAVRGVSAFLLNDFTIIMDSVFYGLLFLGLGYMLYFLRQWGDGDAWLMGALGFLFPDATGFVPMFQGAMPFPFMLIFNFFLVALAYLVVYALVLGIRNPNIYKSFIKNVHERKKTIIVIFVATAAAALFASMYLSFAFYLHIYRFTNLLLVPFAALLLMLFLQYAKAVEKDLFKRKIKAKDLKAGDVLITDKWRGLTEHEVKKLRKRGGEFWIKEGVRFAPVFVINLLLTMFIGNLIVILLPV
ncbi:MAG: prepilin peptidase [Candidatus Aenigmatarchaeota archaeon]|nr:MAG: prepilin peptidase [Candidatus Aenigmarchaeota archaeon]